MAILVLTSKQVLTSQPQTARVLERQRSNTNFVNHSTKKKMSKNKRLSQFECPDVTSQRATGRLLSQLNKCKPKRTKPRSDGPADWSLPWGRKALAGNHVATNLLPKHTHSGRRSLLAPFLSPPCLSEQALIGAPSTRMYLYLCVSTGEQYEYTYQPTQHQYVQLAMCGAGMAR
ncbi:hypothetical protein CI102_8992 [Trichoderma harzianum]|nr:hypothetical protein CI102_8992 [Trichoderma harzianum]